MIENRGLYPIVVEVEGFPTYYVGEEGVWVHNSGCKDDEAALKEKIDEAMQAEAEAQCFCGDTLVIMGDGSRMKIEYMELGCIVLSRNEETGELAECEVLRVFEHEKVELVRVRYQDDVDPRGAVYTTAQHPFWVHGQGWTPVCQLKPGQKLESHHGGLATITKVENAGLKTTVYNLEVAGFHTYFVGYSGILVHNKNTTDQIIMTEMPVVDPNASY